MTVDQRTAVSVRHELPATSSELGPVLAFILFLTVLPLEWITVAGGSTPDDDGNLKPFHIAATIFAIAVFIRWRPSTIIRPVWQRHATLYGSYTVLLATALAANFVYPTPYLPLPFVVRQAAYAVASIIMAGFVIMIVGRPVQRWLTLAGVSASIVLMCGFVIGLASQGQNPITILGRALSQADPDIITYELLRATFRSEGDLPEVAANLRHKVFLGLLIAVLMGLACLSYIDRGQRVLRGVVIVGSGVGFVLTLLSLSRSTILCMSVPFILYPLRVFWRRRARPAEAIAIIVAFATLVAAAISPVGAILYERFGDTQSYTSRLNAAGPTFLGELIPSALMGTAAQPPGTVSPHNFVLNSYLAGGIVGGTAATLLLFWYGWFWIREVWRYVTDAGGWIIPIGQIWALGIGVIPLVRSFTAGNQFHMVELTAIGLFIGFLIANERALRERRHDALSLDEALVVYHRPGVHLP